ncbi:MAG: hypothetical protein GYA16_12005 [Spirochaetes bacterium]|nr:hypothetical protein [Spirochaetota bacterium]
MGVRKLITIIVICFVIIACQKEEANVYDISIINGSLIVSSSKIKAKVSIIEINLYYKDSRRVFSIGKNDVRIENGKATVALLDIFKNKTESSCVFLPFVSNREYYITIEYADRILDELTFFVGNPIKEKSIDLLKDNKSIREDIKMLVLNFVSYRMNY